MSRHRRRTLLLVAVALVATAATVGLIDEATRNMDLLGRLRDATPGWLVVCALGEAFAYAGFVLAYQAMARICDGPHLPGAIVLRVVGLSFGAFAVATSVGGLSTDFWALHQAGEDMVHAGARVIALETLRWAVLAVATCVAGILVLLGVGHPVSPIVPAAWLAITTACFAAGLWVSTPERRGSFPVTGGPLRRAFGVAVIALVYIRDVRRTAPRIRRHAVGGAALFWVGELLCAWAALRAFGARIGIAQLLLGYTTGYVATGLPLPFGGAGGVDAALTGGFVLAGVPLGSALLGAVAFRVFSFWVPALGALASAITVRGLPDRLREIARGRTGPALEPSEGPGLTPPRRSAPTRHRRG